jgi:hypothetical protein
MPLLKYKQLQQRNLFWTPTTHTHTFTRKGGQWKQVPDLRRYHCNPAAGSMRHDYTTYVGRSHVQVLYAREYVENSRHVYFLACIGICKLSHDFHMNRVQTSSVSYIQRSSNREQESNG